MSAIPRELGLHRVFCQIGQGGMGAVFAGFDLEAMEFVAIKTLFADLVDDEVAVGRFGREGEISELLDHTNVVRFHGRGLQDGTHFMGLEYVRGTTVDDLITKETRLNAARVVELMEDCAQGLRHVHSRNVIHRDMKPENVIINQDGILKIIDFGIGILDYEDPFTDEGLVVGTAGYASPEQNQGHDVGAYSDLYSLGAMAWHALVGHRWAQGQTPFQITMQQLSQRPAPPSTLAPGVPARLDQILLRLMEREPTDRYLTAEELLADLQELRKEEEQRGGSENLFADPIASKWSVAKRSFYEKKYALSKSLAKYIADRRPDFAPVHFLLGKLFALENREFNSTDSFQRAMRLDPANFEYPADYSLSLYRMNMFSLAKQELEKLIAARPEHPLGKGFLTLVEEKLAADRAADPRLHEEPEPDDLEDLEPGLEVPDLAPTELARNADVHGIPPAARPGSVHSLSLVFPGLGRAYMGDIAGAIRGAGVVAIMAGLIYALLFLPKAPELGWEAFYQEWVRDHLAKTLDLRRTQSNDYGTMLSQAVWGLRRLGAFLGAVFLTWWWQREAATSLAAAIRVAHRGRVLEVVGPSRLLTSLGETRGIASGTEVEIYRVLSSGRREFRLGVVRIEETSEDASYGSFVADVGVTESPLAGDLLRALPGT